MRDHESAQQVEAREDGAIRDDENNQQWARHNAPEVSKNTNQQNKLWQEKNKWFKIASQDDKRQQDQIGPLI